LHAATCDVSIAGMARRLRLQYPGAIYHIMSRGNARQKIVRDDVDCEQVLVSLKRSVDRCGWRVYAFVLMANHLHLVLKTPRPNLSAGMQSFLSSYAIGWSRRHRQGGHVFSGRYRTELVEDETYLWDLTRYVHLNPVRARLVTDPAAWAWSSYCGYADRRRRLDWVAYDEVLAAWDGTSGGTDPASAYRRFVSAGIAKPPVSPLRQAQHGWLLGSDAFVKRVAKIIRGNPSMEQQRELRRLEAPSVSRVSQVVCTYYGIKPSDLRRRGSSDPARPAFAYLARQHTEATNADLVPVLGLSTPESVPSVTRRFAPLLSRGRRLREDLRRLEEALGVARPKQER
jgi:putative transposase